MKISCVARYPNISEHFRNMPQSIEMAHFSMPWFLTLFAQKIECVGIAPATLSAVSLSLGCLDCWFTCEHCFFKKMVDTTIFSLCGTFCFQVACTRRHRLHYVTVSSCVVNRFCGFHKILACGRVADNRSWIILMLGSRWNMQQSRSPIFEGLFSASPHRNKHWVSVMSLRCNGWDVQGVHD